MRYTLLALFAVVSTLSRAQTVETTVLLSTNENCLNTGHNIINITEPTDYLNNNHQANVYVNYLGDPDTFERTYAIAYPQTWGLQNLVGVPGASHILGLYNQGLPVGSSGIAVNCNEAGFLINTYQFNHTTAIRGGGSGGSLSINPPRLTNPYSTTASSMRIEGRIKHPFHHWNEAEASTQIILYYYMQPKYCGWAPCPLSNQSNGVPTFAHVIAVHDSRTDGTYNEFVGHDTFVSFFSSPLADLQANGQPPEYLSPTPGSRRVVNRYDTWTEYETFSADISYAMMTNMIAKLKAENHSLFANTSSNPADWSVVNVGAIVENMPAYRPDCVRNANPLGCRNSSSAVAFTNIQALEIKPISATGCEASAKICPNTHEAGKSAPAAITVMQPPHLDVLDTSPQPLIGDRHMELLRKRFHNHQ